MNLSVIHININISDCVKLPIKGTKGACADFEYITCSNSHEYLGILKLSMSIKFSICWQFHAFATKMRNNSKKLSITNYTLIGIVTVYTCSYSVILKLSLSFSAMPVTQISTVNRVKIKFPKKVRKTPQNTNMYDYLRIFKIQ